MRNSVFRSVISPSIFLIFILHKHQIHSNLFLNKVVTWHFIGEYKVQVVCATVIIQLVNSIVHNCMFVSSAVTTV